MRWILSLVILWSSVAQSGVSAQSSSQNEIDVEINVTASGYKVALKLDEESCQFGFPGLVEDPDHVVLDDEGQELHREPMGVGNWSMPDDVAFCEQTYEITLPSVDAYTIQIAP